MSSVPEPHSGGGGQRGCAAEPTPAWVPSIEPAPFLPQQPPPRWEKGLETSSGAISWGVHPKSKTGTELLLSCTLGKGAELAHGTTGSPVSCVTSPARPWQLHGLTVTEVSTGKVEFERTWCNEELMTFFFFDGGGVVGTKTKCHSRSFLCPNA